MLTLQNWHNVPGIERCMVNRKGEVASLCRGKTVILQQELHSSGLYSINITTKRKQQKFYVDKIVAITFLENPYNFKHVAHKDGNKNNSNLENLVWSPYPELLQGEWKRIPGHSKYIISETGEVRSLHKQSFSILTPNKRASGYSRYQIYDDEGRRKMCYSHQLVGITFVPNPNDYKFLTHIDKDLSNDHYSNLNWTKTSEEETEDLSEWKRFEKYPKYLFSSRGQVKSYTGHLPTFLKPTHDFHGYKKVLLYNDQRSGSYFLHVIIAKLFVPNPHNLPFVDHINRNKGYCDASNLRWVTASENAKNIDPNTIFGNSRPIFKCDLNGNILAKYVSANEACRANSDIPRSHIRDFANEKTTTHQGFLWIWEKDNVEVEPYKTKEGEIFKNIVGDFDGYILDYPTYQISNFGTVINKNWLKLKPDANFAYPRIHLYKSGKDISFGIHSLVALFFVAGRTAERHVVNHIDEDKNNYHFSNLEWCTQAENAFHSRYKNAKAVKQIHSDTGEIIAIFKSQKDAATALGRSRDNSAISTFFAGLTEKAFGFKWERVTDMNDIVD